MSNANGSEQLSKTAPCWVREKERKPEEIEISRDFAQ
jgi:hypothetical protein